MDWNNRKEQIEKEQIENAVDKLFEKLESEKEYIPKVDKINGVLMHLSTKTLNILRKADGKVQILLCDLLKEYYPMIWRMQEQNLEYPNMEEYIKKKDYKVDFTNQLKLNPKFKKKII